MVISVSLQEESYNIYIERGALARAGELLHLARPCARRDGQRRPRSLCRRGGGRV